MFSGSLWLIRRQKDSLCIAFLLLILLAVRTRPPHSPLSIHFMLYLVSPGGPGKEKKGGKPSARTQPSTRSGTRPHQSTPGRTTKSEQSDEYEQGNCRAIRHLVSRSKIKKTFSIWHLAFTKLEALITLWVLKFNRNAKMNKREYS